jgi:acetyl-CoA carboxylase carboxyl transferase subunit beta
MTWPGKKLPELDASDKKTVGKGVFRKCDGCGETLPSDTLAAHFEVCPLCGKHHRLGSARWRELLLDDGQFDEWAADLESVDALEFADGKPYADRLVSARKTSHCREAVEVGEGRIDGRRVGWGAFVFAFMGGSMGSVVGEKITRMFEISTRENLPVVLLQASGGARMQEGILSLMQMAKTVAALERHKAAGLPYVSVLVHPTTGGVAASFAFLGDVNVAETGALIGFAGPRVIEQTIRQTLPEGFQRAEFLLAHGMVDRVVGRLEMKKEISTLLGHLCSSPKMPKPREI